jgi:hypothetical protein
MPKRLLIIDFSCALGGALAYVLLFDFLQDQLGVPQRLLQFQLGANLLYGMFGVGLFLSGTRRAPYFRFLIRMNLLYAVICTLLGLALLGNTQLLASALILGEVILITGLALWERQMLVRFEREFLP